MSDPTLLIGDIGGTNARFALADPGGAPGFRAAKTLQCADYPSADVAIRRYLGDVQSAAPDVICLAAAGPVADGAVHFTNNHWSLQVADLSEEFDTGRIRIINDFEAIARSVPALSVEDCLPIGLPSRPDLDVDDFSLAIIGPGTGLGMAGLCRRRGLTFPIVGEGGHTGFSPETQLQLDILVALRGRFDRVSVERLVSGPGLENIYWALARVHGEKSSALSAGQIFAASSDGDARATEAVQLFFETLGQVAGNLALLLGPADGVYLAGGIARRYPQLLESSRFRSGFESKGRHRRLMEAIPTLLVTHPEPGLLGAAILASELYAA